MNKMKFLLETNDIREIIFKKARKFMSEENTDKFLSKLEKELNKIPVKLLFDELDYPNPIFSFLNKTIRNYKRIGYEEVIYRFLESVHNYVITKIQLRQSLEQECGAYLSLV